MESVHVPLGQLLVEANLISEAQLADVLERQRSDNRRLGTLLVEAGFIDENTLTQILSKKLNAPWVSLYHVDFSRQLLNLIPRAVSDQYCLIPVYVRHVRRQGDTLYVAMDDPSNEEALHACRVSSGLPVRAMVAPPSDIRHAIRVYYSAEATTGPVPPPEMHPVDSSAESFRPSTSTPPSYAYGPSSALNEAPSIEVKTVPPPAVAHRGPKMIQVTLLDGTVMSLPAPRSRRRGYEEDGDEEPISVLPLDWKDTQLTARDLVAALRAVSHGADASEVLGPSVRWEAMFAAMLSLMLRKHLIADWEFIEEFKKI